MRVLSGLVAGMIGITSVAFADEVAPIQWDDVVETTSSVEPVRLRNYVTVMGGINVWPRNSNDDELESRLPDGYMGLVAVGREMTDHTRVELEVAYRRNDVHGINPTGRSGPRLSGDGNRIHGFSLHGNVAYTFDTFGRFEPYVLAGLGVTHVRVRDEFEDSGRKINDETWAASGQVGIGTRVNINERFALDFGYRYMHALQMEIAWGGDADNKGSDLELNYENHSFLTGLVVKF